ncbi:MAG: hypothetical protein ABI234_12040 [Ktedonobacteraceae bacterium]
MQAREKAEVPARNTTLNRFYKYATQLTEENWQSFGSMSLHAQLQSLTQTANERERFLLLQV